jgi:hypothetical protein
MVWPRSRERGGGRLFTKAATRELKLLADGVLEYWARFA